MEDSENEIFSSILLTTKAHSSQRRPPKANTNPQKPTAVGNGTGCPGVFQGTRAHACQNPYPYTRVQVLIGTGHGLGITHGYQNPYGKSYQSLIQGIKPQLLDGRSILHIYPRMPPSIFLFIFLWLTNSALLNSLYGTKTC